MIWMYWEGPKPLWIHRCQQTVFWHCDDVRLLGPADDELQPLFREVDLSKLCLAHKADFIRAYMMSNNMNRGVNPGHDLLKEKTFFHYLLRQSRRNIGTGPIRISGTPMEAGKC